MSSDCVKFREVEVNELCVLGLLLLARPLACKVEGCLARLVQDMLMASSSSRSCVRIQFNGKFRHVT